MLCNPRQLNLPKSLISIQVRNLNVGFLFFMRKTKFIFWLKTIRSTRWAFSGSSRTTQQKSAMTLLAIRTASELVKSGKKWFITDAKLWGFVMIPWDRKDIRSSSAAKIATASQSCERKRWFKCTRWHTSSYKLEIVLISTGVRSLIDLKE